MGYKEPPKDKQWKKGESGNKKGKQPGSISITTAIRNKLLEVYIDPKNPEESRKIRKTYLDKIIESIMHNAVENRDARSLKDVWNYIDGLPKGTLAIDANKEDLAALTDYFKAMGNAKKS